MIYVPLVEEEKFILHYIPFFYMDGGLNSSGEKTEEFDTLDEAMEQWNTYFNHTDYSILRVVHGDTIYEFEDYNEYFA